MGINKNKKTKIVVTMGPSMEDESVIDKCIKHGANVFRCNFSHGEKNKHLENISKIRRIASSNKTEVTIMVDLQGPKIRVGRFLNDKVFLENNNIFTLDTSKNPSLGNEEFVGVDYNNLINDVTVGNILLLDDGRIVLEIKELDGNKIICKVLVGGSLSNNKGINLKGGGLSAGALTEKDIGDIEFASNLDVDYFAISFVNTAEDVENAKKIIKKNKSSAGIIAKIERKKALKNIEEIIKAADGIMVARGDLGVEIGDEELPAVQKNLINIAKKIGKPVITATQMMQSMIHDYIPTRAEVFDVANAVLDNSDAVMLSNESAVGDHPDIVVEAMSRICFNAEKNFFPKEFMALENIKKKSSDAIDKYISIASMYIANGNNIDYIISLTESGVTPLIMSRIPTNIPIFAVTRNLETMRKVNLYKGVYPVYFDITEIEGLDIDKEIIKFLLNKKIIKKNTLSIITRGDILGECGHTNTMKIIKS